MNRHVLRYYFTEGFRSLFLHAFSSFAAVGVISACLLIMGSFTLVAVNLQEMVTEMEQSSPLVLDVADYATDAQARRVGSRISDIGNVRHFEYISSEEAFGNFIERLGPVLAKDIPPDLFPHRYNIFLVNVEFAEETRHQLLQIADVAEVRNNRDIFSVLLSVRRAVRLVSAVLIAALLVVSLFIMQNTIKLATFERREEIAIMRVVGATKGFIRWPFVVQGFLTGSFAGGAAYVLELAAYTRFADALASISEFKLIPFSQLWLPVFTVFVLTGFLVGVFGSVLTIRKYLKA